MPFREKFALQILLIVARHLAPTLLAGEIRDLSQALKAHMKEGERDPS